MTLNLRLEPGWTGIFTRDQAPGARCKNGSRIVKVAKDENDANEIGVTGTVLGSLMHPDAGIGYFVEWDARPRMAVFVISWKIDPLEGK